MNKDPKISNIQIRALIVSTIMGIGILSLPNQLAQVMDKDGWIAIIFSSLLVIPLILVIIQIFKDNPGKDFYEIGYESFGKIIFTICLIMYLVYFVIVSAYISRSLGELIKGFLLTQTPIGLVTVLFIITIAYGAISEIDVIARVAYIVYPLVIGFAVLLFLLALPGSDFTNILPMFQSDLGQLPEGMKVAMFSFSGFEILLFVIPFAEEKKKLTKTSISAIAIVSILYFILFMVTLTQFSIEQIKSDPFPLLMIAKLIDLPGYFLQNLDGMVMAIWVVVIFSTMLPLYNTSGKILAKIFKTKSHTSFVLILIPIIYLIAFIPSSVVEVNKSMGRIIDYLATVTIVIIPIVLLIVSRIRGRKNQ